MTLFLMPTLSLYLFSYQPRAVLGGKRGPGVAHLCPDNIRLQNSTRGKECPVSDVSFRLSRFEGAGMRTFCSGRSEIGH